MKIKLEDNLRILFQGDSITDGNRGRNQDLNHILGHGYQYIIAAKFYADYPQKGLHFMNRGVSGNTVDDIYNRRIQDITQLKPDVMSLLVGVNDLGKMVTPRDYNKNYRLLLDSIKCELSDIKLVLIEPFILEVKQVEGGWDKRLKMHNENRQIVRNIAKDYDAIFVPMQDMFDELSKKVNAKYWLWDGVHPTIASHEMMARRWIECVINKEYL